MATRLVQNVANVNVELGFLFQLIKKTGRKGLTEFQSAYRRCENIINLTEFYRSLSLIHMEDTVFSLQKSTI